MTIEQEIAIITVLTTNLRIFVRKTFRKRSFSMSKQPARPSKPATAGISNLAQKFPYGEGITYDDVLLLPGYSEVLPREVDIATYLTRRIKLFTPFVSSAM